MTIGENIAKLRKERNITQAELANAVNVSAQAVSKWENGGVPDTELLPAIADFFETSLDTLFGRDGDKFVSLERKIAKAVSETDDDDRFELMYNLCWSMNGANIYDCERKMKNEQTKDTYSSYRTDSGYTIMNLDWDCPYFLLAPDSPNKTTKLLENRERYIELFSDLADKDFFDTLVFFYKREGFKGFTDKVLVNNLGFTPERSKEMITRMKKYGLISSNMLELDDEEIETFEFRSQPAFVSLLLFAREMVLIPNKFWYFMGGRNKPYLK